MARFFTLLFYLISSTTFVFSESGSSEFLVGDRDGSQGRYSLSNSLSLNKNYAFSLGSVTQVFDGNGCFVDFCKGVKNSFIVSGAGFLSIKSVYFRNCAPGQILINDGRIVVFEDDVVFEIGSDFFLDDSFFKGFLVKGKLTFRSLNKNNKLIVKKKSIFKSLQSASPEVKFENITIVIDDEVESFCDDDFSGKFSFVRADVIANNFLINSKLEFSQSVNFKPSLEKKFSDYRINSKGQLLLKDGVVFNLRQGKLSFDSYLPTSILFENYSSALNLYSFCLNFSPGISQVDLSVGRLQVMENSTISAEDKLTFGVEHLLIKKGTLSLVNVVLRSLDKN